MVEVMITLVVLVLASGGIVTTLLQSRQLNSYNREHSLAVDAAESKLEELYAFDFDEVFARCNADPADDPDGVGTADGRGFAVPGLALVPDDADGLAGEVLFPVDGGQLREDLDDPLFGTPRDLDLDQFIDGTDHATDYRVLPIAIRITWRGVAGNQQYTFRHVLSTSSD